MRDYSFVWLLIYVVTSILLLKVYISIGVTKYYQNVVEEFLPNLYKNSVIRLQKLFLPKLTNTPYFLQGGIGIANLKKLVYLILFPIIIFLGPYLILIKVIRLLKCRLLLKKSKVEILEKLEICIQKKSLLLSGFTLSESDTPEIYIPRINSFLKELKVIDDIQILINDLVVINEELGISNELIHTEIHQSNTTELITFLRFSSEYELISNQIAKSLLEKHLLEDVTGSELNHYSLNPTPIAYVKRSQQEDQLSVIDSDHKEVKSWQSIFTSKFKKAVKMLDKNLQGRVFSAILEILDDPVKPKGDTVKPLHANLAGMWRYRLGDYRLLYFPELQMHQIMFIDISSRGGVYEN